MAGPEAPQERQQGRGQEEEARADGPGAVARGLLRGRPSAHPRERTLRAGTPATSARSGTSSVTTLPAATNDPAPIRTPGRREAFAPTKEPRPMRTAAVMAGDMAWSGGAGGPTRRGGRRTAPSGRVTSGAR